MQAACLHFLDVVQHQEERQVMRLVIGPGQSYTPEDQAFVTALLAMRR
jgi:hypothetical protein